MSNQSIIKIINWYFTSFFERFHTLFLILRLYYYVTWCGRVAVWVGLAQAVCTLHSSAAAHALAGRRLFPLCPASCYIHEDRGRRSTRWRTLEPLLPGHRTLDGKNPTALTACRPLLPLPAPCSTKCVLNPHPSFSSTQVGAMLRNFPQARRLLRCAPSVPVAGSSACLPASPCPRFLILSFYAVFVCVWVGA